MSYGRFVHERQLQEREIREAQRRGKPARRLRAAAWIAEHTPELSDSSLVLGCVMTRLGHPSLTASAIRARYGGAT